MKKTTLFLAAALCTAVFADELDTDLSKLADLQKVALVQARKAEQSLQTGLSLLTQQKYQEAVSPLLEAAAANPSDPRSYYHLAAALSGSGRVTEARRVLRMAFDFLDDPGKTGLSRRFAADSQAGKPFYNLVNAYVEGLVSGAGWGASPDDVEGLVRGRQDTFYAKVSAKAAPQAVDRKNEGMIEATCRKAAKDMGSIRVLEAISRNALKAAQKTSGEVRVGGASCSIGENTSCKGMIRSAGLVSCEGRGPGGSFADCECTVYLRVPEGKASVQVL